MISFNMFNDNKHDFKKDIAIVFKGVCSDHFFDPLLSEIKLEILISYESPYFSHNPCEILRLNYVSLKRYDQNSLELLENWLPK